MNNQGSYQNIGGYASNVSIVAPPPVETLQSKAEGIASSLHEINEKLKFIKARLFGAEPEPPKSGSNGGGQQSGTPDIGWSLEFASQQSMVAHGQLQAILDRL